MNTQQSVVAEYFGELVAPNRMYSKRLECFTKKFEALLTHYYPAQQDTNHSFFLIADFLFVAEDYMCDDNPIALKEIKEIAQNLIDGHLEMAEKMRLDALSGDTVHYGFDPVTDQKAKFDINPRTMFDRALNTKPSLGHVALKELHKVHSRDLRVHAEILENQAGNFQIWLRSRDAKVFFECYMALRTHECNKHEKRQRKLNNV